MTVSLRHLPKGHRFPPVAFHLSSHWVGEYLRAVEDAAIVGYQGVVPPMALAALSISAFLESASLPPGSVHLGQELSFHRAARIGEHLRAEAEIVSRGERQGWVLMGVALAVTDDTDAPVMTGRASVTFPLDPEAPA